MVMRCPARSRWRFCYDAWTRNFHHPRAVISAMLDSREAVWAVVEVLRPHQFADPRHEILAQAQTVLFNDLPVIPLWYQNAFGGYSENVDNVAFDWKSVPMYYAITKAE